MKRTKQGRNSYYSDKRIIEIAEEEVRSFIDKHQDEIVEAAAKTMADSLTKRKLFNQAIKEVIQKETYKTMAEEKK